MALDKQMGGFLAYFCHLPLQVWKLKTSKNKKAPKNTLNQKLYIW